MKAHVSISYGLVALLLVMISLWCTEAKVHTVIRQLEVRQLLKRLNKPAIKSIKSPDGDIIDCVHISHQPAFDHPLLKNHTIQMRPSFFPLGLNDENKVASKKETRSIHQLWHQNGRCPEGTIPIRRTKKDDVLRAISIDRYGKKMPNPTSVELDQTDMAVREVAGVFVRRDNFFGARAVMNVWNPMVQTPDEYSAARVLLLGAQQLNSIQAGWHVHPSLYGDNKTRLFGNWAWKIYKLFGARTVMNVWNSKVQTPDEYNAAQLLLLGAQRLHTIRPGWHVQASAYGDNKTRLSGYQANNWYFTNGGCWNLFCPGFVQVNNDIVLGSALDPISSYGGNQYDFTVMLFKDPRTRNWWLAFGNQIALGYWPASLLPDLNGGASAMEWGGEVLNHKQNSQHTTTEMGSGHFAEEDFGKASFFKNIQIVLKGNFILDPTDIEIDTTHSNCYNVHNDHSSNWGYYFYYGGPGRNPNCS